MAGQILFIYRGKKGACNIKTIYRKLHGSKETRTAANEFGGAVHKTFEYPGTPHSDLIRGAFFVSARDEKGITDFFERFKVPYVRIRPREVKISNWLAGGACQKREAV